MSHIPKAIWAAVFLVVALLVILPGAGADDLDNLLARRPPMEPAMRDAFDRAAKKWLYREECRCLYYLTDDWMPHQVEWPPTDDDRRRIHEALKNGPWLPPMPWSSPPPTNASALGIMYSFRAVDVWFVS